MTSHFVCDFCTNFFLVVVTRFVYFASSVLSSWHDALALISSPSFPLPFCQELGAHIPHALLAQPEKYGTVTATVLPDWTGTLMRRLTALIHAASTEAFEYFYSFTGPPPMCSYTVCFVFVHFFVRVRSTCSMYSLCSRVRGEPAGRVP